LLFTLADGSVMAAHMLRVTEVTSVYSAGGDVLQAWLCLDDNRVIELDRAWWGSIQKAQASA
jgi:hypothetical protein